MPIETFFEGFRRALDEFPAGLIRAGAAASEADIKTVATRLKTTIPPSYVAFLRLFDGADLFHESIVLCGVGPQARSLVDVNQRAGGDAPMFVFAESSSGDRFHLGTVEGHKEHRVFRTRADSEERWLTGATFARWLDSVLARERILYDEDGEFLLEAFDEDGEELTPLFALRQAERALRRDPASADSHHDKGVALRQLGRMDQAAAAFAKAADLDPENPWPWFHLGRVELGENQPALAMDSFRRAAEATPGKEGARFLVWAARAAADAGRTADADRAKSEATTRHPGIAAELQKAVESAMTEHDDSATDEAISLASLFSPPEASGTGKAVPPRFRLPVVSTAPAAPATTSAAAPARVRAAPVRPPQRPAPPRPRRAGRRRP